MNCRELRESLRAGDEIPGMHEHIRQCPDCLEAAIAVEPATLFVTLGGSDAVPPGGLDAFVSDVINEVRVRDKEKNLDSVEGHPVRVAWWWSAAAAVFILLTTWLAVQPGLQPDLTRPEPVAALAETAEPTPIDQPSITRPVIDEYARSEAMIVELPAESDDIKIVMIFDETLPQDL